MLCTFYELNFINQSIHNAFLFKMMHSKRPNKEAFGILTKLLVPAGVSITYQYKVKLQPKHDPGDSRTCWHLNLKAAVRPARIPSPIILLGPQFGHHDPAYLSTPSMSSLLPYHWPARTTWEPYQPDLLD